MAGSIENVGVRQVYIPREGFAADLRAHDMSQGTSGKRPAEHLPFPRVPSIVRRIDTQASGAEWRNFHDALEDRLLGSGSQVHDAVKVVPVRQLEIEILSQDEMVDIMNGAFKKVARDRTNDIGRHRKAHEITDEINGAFADLAYRQECLDRAAHCESPDLISRSYNPDLPPQVYVPPHVDVTLWGKASFEVSPDKDNRIKLKGHSIGVRVLDGFGILEANRDETLAWVEEKYDMDVSDVRKRQFVPTITFAEVLPGHNLGRKAIIMPAIPLDFPAKPPRAVRP